MVIREQYERKKVLRGAKPRAGLRLTGSGGGKGGQKDNDPNSLRSNAIIRLIDLLGEGEIKGLVNGPHSIYFDSTPLKSIDGTENFKGVTWETRNGLPDQSFVPGFNAVENEIIVSTQVKKSLPVTRALTDTDLDAARVTIRIPALTKRNKKHGNMERTSVSFRIEVRHFNGVWVKPFGDITITGKCTSPYDKDYFINLPKASTGASAPWEIRVTRITDDSEDIELQNDTYFAAMTAITFGKFTYPYSALIAMTASADQFGQSVPERSYEVYGRIIRVPANYNPTTRTYSGVWNGTFKWAWCDNPAWVLYDMLIDDRFGLGEYIDVSQVDKWSLYEIAQYCDQLIPDGKGGTGPRFTFNAWIRDRKEAYDALQNIASAFRGMTYWSSGSVMAAQDRPDAVSVLASPSNVVDGSFSYQGSGLKARHTVAVVKWTNPDRNYEADFVVVEDSDGLERYGYREIEIDAVGCTDRAQAYRLGKWTLFTELNETQVIGYTAGLDHAGARPGDIVAVQDPSIADIDLAGRLKGGNSNTILNLDHPVKFENGKNYTISVMLPNGKVEEKDIAVSVRNVDVTQITVTSGFSAVPEAEANWIIASNSLKPSLWRVVSIREAEPHLYEVSAVQHEPGKFNYVDLSARFDPLPVVEERTVQPPTNLTVQETLYIKDGRPKSTVLLSWTAPSVLSAPVAYDVSCQGPNGPQTFGRVRSNSITMMDLDEGEYTFFVSTVSFNGRVSLPAELAFTTEGWRGSPVGTVENLRLRGKPAASVDFTGPDVEFVWDNVYPASVKLREDGTNPLFKDNIVRIFDATTGELLRTDSVGIPRYSYPIQRNWQDNIAYGRGPSRYIRIEVQLQDVYGRLSPTVTHLAQNPQPPMLNPQFTPSFGQFFLRWDPNEEPDFAGYLVWASPVKGFNPATTPPHSDGRQNMMTIMSNDGAKTYVRVAAYDSFGKFGLNYSSELECSSLSTIIDTVPPAVPTGLALTSTLDAVDSGFVKLVAKWNANTETDLAYYDLQISENGGDWISTVLTDVTMEFRLRPNTPVRARIRAVDVAGNKSAFAAIVNHTTVKDTTPPAVPAGFVASTGLDSIWLKWNANTEADFSHYELYESATNDSATATKIANVPGNAFARTGLALETTRYYWLKAVDTSANASAFSAVASGTTGTLPENDVVTVENVQFQPNVQATNRLNWTAGTISYGPAGGLAVSKAITAGFVDWASGTVYVYYVKGNTALSTTTNLVTLYASGGVLLGVYKGGTNFQLVEGKALIDGATILAQTVGAAQLVTDTAVITGTAQIKDAIVTDAKVTTISAKKLVVLPGDSGLPATITVGTTGVSIGTIESRASDPATRINERTTLIDAGKIVVSGSTTIADWRKGGDLTRIDGGMLSANTVRANAMEIGSRNLTLEGVVFEHNSPAGNRASWTAGSIRYINDAGSTVSKAIAAGSTGTWASGVMYIYWTKDDTKFQVTTSPTTAFAVDNVVIATYRGGIDLDPDYGRTIIDGAGIKANTITATQVDVVSLRTAILIANAIKTEMLAADIITAKHVLLTDTSNILPDNALQDESAWRPGGVSNPFIGDYSTFGRAWRFTSNGASLSTSPSVGSVISKKFPVTPGESLSWGATVDHNGTSVDNRIRLYLRFFDSDGAVISQPSKLSAATTAVQSVRSNAVVPDGAVTADYYIRRDVDATGNTSQGTSYVWNCFVYRRMDADLIVEGSIQAKHISADKIDAKVLLVNGTLITDLIQNNAVTETYSAWSSGTTTLASVANGSISGEATAQTLSVPNPNGYPVIILASTAGSASSVNQTGGTAYAALTFKLMRGSTLLRTGTRTVDEGHPNSFDYNPSDEFVMMYYDAAPPKGTSIYSIVGNYSITANGPAGSGNVKAFARFITALVRKK